MARRRGSGQSGGRGSRRFTRRQSAPPVHVFDDAWFASIRERRRARYVDLTSVEDRRRWSPQRLRSMGPEVYEPRGLDTRPRIVIVPEGHKLARHQTYGGRYSLKQILKFERLRRPWSHVVGEPWQRSDWRYGDVKAYARHPLSRSVGFTLPWQVIVCVRRKQRREVMHALKVAGKGGVGRGKKQRRTEFSEVRC